MQLDRGLTFIGIGEKSGPGRAQNSAAVMAQAVVEKAVGEDDFSIVHAPHHDARRDGIVEQLKSSVLADEPFERRFSDISLLRSQLNDRIITNDNVVRFSQHWRSSPYGLSIMGCGRDTCHAQ